MTSINEIPHDDSDYKVVNGNLNDVEARMEECHQNSQRFVVTEIFWQVVVAFERSYPNWQAKGLKIYSQASQVIGGPSSQVFRVYFDPI